jgi:hypothetical protein
MPPVKTILGRQLFSLQWETISFIKCIKKEDEKVPTLKNVFHLCLKTTNLPRESRYFYIP